MQPQPEHGSRDDLKIGPPEPCDMVPAILFNAKLMRIGRADDIPLDDEDEDDEDESLVDESSELEETLDETSSFSLEDDCGSAMTNACTCSDSSWSEGELDADEEEEEEEEDEEDASDEDDDEDGKCS